MSAELRTCKPHVVFQECPGEVALAFTCYGCPVACKGCHSPEVWNSSNGDELSDQEFERWILQYEGLITTVVFFGGEWALLSLKRKLEIARKYKIKTCLYSGLKHLSRHLRPLLDYVKLGPWISECGGLDNPATNQRYYRLVDGEVSEDLTYLFQTASG